ncbi:MAG: GNAT family N-acetyltransferase [Boseongicola sp.]|nr:GNAT family N-acetyltransferase [Boseongicola sp.]NNJ69255.1 GNAT family N-acetyltransferase [Boseongicola sp.]
MIYPFVSFHRHAICVSVIRTLSRGEGRVNQLIAQKRVSRGRTQARYRVRFVDGRADFEAALALRGRVFRGGASDADQFDDLCRHMVIERLEDGAVVGAFRVMSFACGAEIARSYSAQSYGLSALAAYPAPMLELGRFCIAPEVSDPDILRVAWGGLARIVDEEGIAFLFGCSSFRGTDAGRYRDAFALLRERFLAPKAWAPTVKASEVAGLGSDVSDRGRALKAMPPLLRSYLTMGGWVSDHAVVDRDMDTLHVFTGLEIASIPAARARSIRASVL